MLNKEQEKKIEAHTKISMAAYDKGIENGKKEVLASLQEKIEELKQELCYDKDEICSINICKTQGGKVYVCPSCKKFEEISKIFQEMGK